MNDGLLLRWYGSLKARLALAGVLALVFSVGITTMALLWRARADTLAAREQLELSEAARTARLLSMQVVQQQRALTVTAALLNPSVFANPAAMTAFLADKPVLLTLFDSVFLADRDGHLRAIHDAKGLRAVDIDLSDRDYMRKALSEGRPVVSQPLRSRLSIEPIVALVQPMRAGGQSLGLLGGALHLKSRNLLDAVDAAQSEDNALVLVTDAQGRIISHPDPELIGSPASAEPRLVMGVERWRAAGQPVEPSGLSFSTDDSLISVAGVAGPDWLVWRSRQRSDVLAPLDSARRAAQHWAAAVVVGLAGALGLLLWWLLRPLTKLQARAEHLFDASLDPQAGWPGSRGEIGRLERVLRHVSAERAQLEAFNHQVIRRLESVMKAAPVGIAFTRNKRFELVSREFCLLLGRDEAALLGEQAQVIYASNEDYLRIGDAVGDAFAAGRAYDGEWELLRGDGRRFWGHLRGQPVDPNEPVAGTIWTISDITERVANRHALEWAANHDALTGLANRKAFEARLEKVFEALPHSRPAALVLFDLDRFKPINDRHGHAAGDAMLRAVAAAVSQRVRSGDLLVRLGGDEFAVVLERCPPEVAARVADDMRAAVANLRLPWEDKLLDVGASLGVAALSEHLATPAAWIAAADHACYEAKAAGRGVVRHAGPAALRLVPPPPDSSVAGGAG